MLFQFQVDVTPQMYVDYNAFVMTKTAYGKSQIRKFRIAFSALTVMATLYIVFSGEPSAASLLSCIPLLAVWALFMWLFPHMVVAGTKASIKDMHKKGKLCYDPHAELVFYDDHFEEIVPDKRTTQAYTTLERVSVDGGKAVYLHMDNLRAYIVPTASFDSAEQYQQFLHFLNSKHIKADVY